MEKKRQGRIGCGGAAGAALAQLMDAESKRGPALSLQNAPIAVSARVM